MNEWLIDQRTRLGLGQDEVDRRTRDLGARVSQPYLSQLERGVKALEDLGGARMDALRRVYQVSPEAWTDHTGLAIVTPQQGPRPAASPAPAPLPDGLQQVIQQYGAVFSELQEHRWQHYLARLKWRGGLATPDQWFNVFQAMRANGIEPDH
ncbi:hypothetical protein [Deinococcus sonorensis]|uniref:HTH cro/C1-type domain-containing protein n=2 Tax=Deinococcus sonorensis TaxID=309891 RepID=A0AAU7UD32_9DEIO